MKSDFFKRIKLIRWQILTVMGLILLFGWLLRWGYGELHPGLGRDESYYMENIKNVIDGAPISSFTNRPPLLIWLGATFHHLSDTPEQSLRIVTRLIGLLFIVPWYFIGKRLFEDVNKALLLMLLAASVPFAVEMSNSVLRESLSLPVYAFMFWFLLEYWQKPRCRYSCLCAFACGIGLCVRYEIIEFAVIFAAVGVFAAVRRKISVPVMLRDILIMWIVTAAVFAGIYWLLGYHVGEMFESYANLFWRHLK